MLSMQNAGSAQGLDFLATVAFWHTAIADRQRDKQNKSFHGSKHGFVIRRGCPFALVASPDHARYCAARRLSSSAMAHIAEAGEPAKHQCPGRQFRAWRSHLEFHALLDRVILATSRLPQPIIVGRIPPEVPVAARILNGGEEQAVDIELACRSG